jgi:hypothetical protein
MGVPITGFPKLGDLDLHIVHVSDDVGGKDLLDLGLGRRGDMNLARLNAGVVVGGGGHAGRFWVAMVWFVLENVGLWKGWSLPWSDAGGGMMMTTIPPYPQMHGCWYGSGSWDTRPDFQLGLPIIVTMRCARGKMNDEERNEQNFFPAHMVLSVKKISCLFHMSDFLSLA